MNNLANESIVFASDDNLKRGGHDNDSNKRNVQQAAGSSIEITFNLVI